ncbi:MAG: segregation/condensation protein A [Ruminococcus sp.]|nr:segregation/condensation protein A [Ruminococcus sp.]
MESIKFKLDAFEGPLDLLLHLVSKHKLNIYDIEISLLLEQYLEYISGIEDLDYEIAADFFEMAARLIYIKTCYLLPQPEEAEELKKELQGRMIEYSLCKLAAQRLRDDYAGGTVFVRAPVKLPVNKQYSRTHDKQELYDAYMAIFSKVKNYTPLRANLFSPIVSKRVVSVESKITYILTRLYETGEFEMSALYEGMTDRSERIATFLAVLELTKAGNIRLNDDNTVITLGADKPEEDETSPPAEDASEPLDEPISEEYPAESEPMSEEEAAASELPDDTPPAEQEELALPEAVKADEAAPETEKPTAAPPAEQEELDPTEAVKADEAAPEEEKPAAAAPAEQEEPAPTEAVKADEAAPEAEKPVAAVPAEQEEPAPPDAVNTDEAAPESEKPAAAAPAEQEEPAPPKAVKTDEAAPEAEKPAEILKSEPRAKPFSVQLALGTHTASLRLPEQKAVPAYAEIAAPVSGEKAADTVSVIPLPEQPAAEERPAVSEEQSSPAAAFKANYFGRRYYWGYAPRFLGERSYSTAVILRK